TGCSSFSPYLTPESPLRTAQLVSRPFAGIIHCSDVVVASWVADWAMMLTFWDAVRVLPMVTESARAVPGRANIASTHISDTHLALTLSGYSWADPAGSAASMQSSTYVDASQPRPSHQDRLPEQVRETTPHRASSLILFGFA